MSSTTVTHPETRRAIVREGCALRLLRDVTGSDGRVHRTGKPLTAVDAHYPSVHGEVWTEIGPVPLEAVEVDLTRASGQWAAAMWAWPLIDEHTDVPTFVAIEDALRGESDPAELCLAIHQIAGVRHG